MQTMALICIKYDLFSKTLASERGQRLADCRNLGLRHNCISSRKLVLMKPLVYVAVRLEPE